MDLFKFEKEGYYGRFGGTFIPEILHSTVSELTKKFREVKEDPYFWKEYVTLMQQYSGRPTPVTHLTNLSEYLGGAQIYVKREDLNHTGAHKANNVMGQGLLVKRMGKTRVIGETGAGQHGVATATMAAKFGFDCTIYMGAVDVARQRPNVFWMEKMGAQVVAVEAGQKTLKDAINECLRDWVDTLDNTHYVLGTACGFHPFPEMVSWFQSIIGIESREQIQEIAGRLPDRVYASIRSVMPPGTAPIRKSSASKTANGSSPTARSAQSTAWPSPSCSGWRTNIHSTCGGTILRRFSASACLPLARNAASNSRLLSK